MGSGREQLEPLYDIHDVDPVPHDFGILFKIRGSSATELVTDEEMVREEGALWLAPITPDRELPYAVTITYADEETDQGTNTVRSSRFGDTADTTNIKAIDGKTWVSDPEEAQPLADRLFRRMWGEREKPEFTLKVGRSAFEPGDVIEIAPDGVNRLVRITEITRSGVNLKIKSVRDDPRLHDPNAAVGPSLDARDEETIFVPAPTKGIAADIPYTRDSENDVNPTLRYAAGAYPSTDWPGAIFWQADNDNDELFPWNTVATENEMTWGVVEDALPAPVTPWMWDRANTIDVTVYGGGTLSNSTEAAINADPTVNQAIVSTVVDGEPAWEIINFASASLLGTANGHNQYRLSTLKRGRRGTEWACEGHAVGDTFVLTSSLLSEGMGLDDIGDELTFKPQSVGRNPVIAPETSLTFTGASLKPYALVIWHVTKESNGDLTIEIRTRTRIGGAWNGTTISTGETIAEYEFDVYDGATFKRTLESTDKTFTYTAADQTTDFGSEITAADLEGFAYQLSATVGRGFERAA